MSRRTSRVLTTSALVLAATIGAEAWYVWGAAAPAPTSQRPVVVGDIAARSVVDVAATDAAAIFSTSPRRYDDHVARTTALMTPGMAARYRSTAAHVRTQVIAAGTTTTTRVAATGVVRASGDEVLALLFLDQRTTTAGGRPSYDARRALVTMVRTERGWLVDNVQTR
jgi:Mce-associated membrane protein